MRTLYTYIIAFVLCLMGAAAQGQNSYLLNFEHKEARSTEKMYFYLEQLPSEATTDRADVVALEDAFYRVYFLRLSEPSASTYLGCSKYSNQAAGELLSLRNLLTDSVLYNYEQKQQAIETKCNALLDNKGRQNSVLVMDLNDQDRVKMVGVKFDLCNCKVSRRQFSPLTDTLAMVRNIERTTIFSDSEKTYWKDHIGIVLDNAFVKSCLPPPDRFDKIYQASRE